MVPYIRFSESGATHRRRAIQSGRIGLLAIIVLMLSACLVVSLACWMFWKYYDALEWRNAAFREDKFSYIGHLVVKYEVKYGHLPPAYTLNDDGVRRQSWRGIVAVDHRWFHSPVDLYANWDSPKNRKVIDPLESCGLCFSADPEHLERTNLFVVVGPHTAFPGDKTTKIEDITDGPENTALLIEADMGDDFWSEPRDISEDELDDLYLRTERRLKRYLTRQGDVIVTFADGQCWPLVSMPDRPTFRAMFTIAGHDGMTRAELRDRGYLQ